MPIKKLVTYTTYDLKIEGKLIGYVNKRPIN